MKSKMVLTKEWNLTSVKIYISGRRTKLDLKKKMQSKIKRNEWMKIGRGAGGKEVVVTPNLKATAQAALVSDGWWITGRNVKGLRSVIGEED